MSPSLPKLQRAAVLGALLAIAPTSFALSQQSPNAADAPPAAEAPFLQENDAAMARMMTDMTVKPTGDVDRDFVAMMVPHHQGAIDMAKAVLRYGHNEQIRRIAQEIIVDQLQEIAAMRLALGETLPPSVASPTAPSAAEPAPAAAMPGMNMNGME